MDSQWLKTQFQHNPNRTKAALAKALGLEPSAISKILKGTRQIKAQEYIIMRRFFGLSDQTTGAALPPKVSPDRQAQLSDSAAQHVAAKHWVPPHPGPVSGAVSGAASGAGAGAKNRKKAPSGDLKIIVVSDNLMEPDLVRGEHVLIDAKDTDAGHVGLFAVSDGFTEMIRLCEHVKGAENREIRISANIPNFHPQILSLQDFSILGRVIAKVNWL